MARAANATVHKTPPPADVLSPEIKSTPNAVGTAAISENMHTIGTNVDDIRPWIMRDIKDHRKCGINEMLRELLARCSVEPDSNKSVRQKETLLKNVFDEVLKIWDNSMKEEMEKQFNKFIDCNVEELTYKPFVEAANYALSRLKKVKARGIVPHDGSDDTDIIFHHNNMPIRQKHQGVESHRKPDVVIVSHETAREVYENGTKASKNNASTSNPSKRTLTSIASQKPEGRFEWPDILSTWECKRPYKPDRPNYDDVKITSPNGKYMVYGKKSRNVVEPTGSTPSGASGESGSNTLRRSERLRSSNGGKKRESDDHGANDRSSKRMKSDRENVNSNRDNDKVTKKIDPMEQNGLYTAEMFAAHVARQHVLSFVVESDMIYIWYFDRQDAIQSCGFSFMHDLPHFLVLLLILQRMSYADWGHNPLFSPEPGVPAKVEVKDEIGTVDLDFDFYSSERITHYGLRGRATNVFPVTSEALSRRAGKRSGGNTSEELVAKIYWPEETRQSEAEILKAVEKIATETSEVKGHVPEVIWSHKFEGTSTATIREALGIGNAQIGRRVLYMIVFRKLRPITELSGDEFMRAWWHAVVCHRALWERGVRHRDISPSNLMYYRNSKGEVIGVLNDYDLSSMKDTPSGRERTGTIPFMALDLLVDAAIEGKVEHLYQHDAESFIWVLTWVSLRYEDGKLRGKGSLLDEWLTVDAKGCREKKFDFLGSGRYELVPSSSYEMNWPIVESSLDIVSFHYAARRKTLKVDEVFEEWFKNIPSKFRNL